MARKTATEGRELDYEKKKRLFERKEFPEGENSNA